MNKFHTKRKISCAMHVAVQYASYILGLIAAVLASIKIIIR